MAFESALKQRNRAMDGNGGTFFSCDCSAPLQVERSVCAVLLSGSRKTRAVPGLFAFPAPLVG